MNNIRFQFANAEDEAQVRELLVQSQLPHEDIAPHLRNFILAWNDKEIIGCVGLEIVEGCALLRSLAVSASHRSLGIGSQLCAKIHDYARSRNLHTLYLMTKSVDKYFANKGYEQIDRELAPAGIRSTRQFTEFCPTSAILMKIQL